MGLTSASFQKLVRALKTRSKNTTVVEQCCGGTISSSIMAQPGASSVYLGGTVAYNTRKGMALLLNDEKLHASLTSPNVQKTKDAYIQSKIDWTAKTSVAFCETLDTDFAIAEGGASGPTFGPPDMKTGFSVLSVAGRCSKENKVKVLATKVVHSTHANREQNMRLFADSAADLLTDVVLKEGNYHGNAQINEESTFDTMVVLDRATALRTDEKTLAGMEVHAKYVLVQKSDILVKSSTELALLSDTDVAHLKNDQNQMTFLGVLSNKEKTPIFGIDINENLSVSFNECEFVDTRTSAPLLPRLDNELALHMTAYANWQRNATFCTSCGGPTILLHAGTTRQCMSCKALSWPRQDPSMIASITSRCGERILLARSPRHPPKMHTVLAGFVEAGERFETAVARETWEETGIRIDEGSVSYIGSQPWPFPQSCMIAFTATADDSQPLNIDENEIVEAQWFTREEVLAATEVEGAVMQHEVAEKALKSNPEIPLLIPPKRVIARTLIDTWLGKV